MRESEKTDPSSHGQQTKNKIEDTQDKTSNFNSRLTQQNKNNPYYYKQQLDNNSQYPVVPKFSIPLFTPEYPEDDPDYSAFSRFKDVSSHNIRKVILPYMEVLNKFTPCMLNLY